MELDVSVDTVAERIANGGPMIRERDGFMVRCPAHDDGRPSLHFSPVSDQPVLLRCFAGCTAGAVLAAAGMTVDDVAKPRTRTPARSGGLGPPEAVYSYIDEAGRHLFEVVC